MITIKHGGCGLMGRWIKAWFLHRTGKEPRAFKKLADAMACAVASGASGDWIRSVENSGPRRAEVVVYTDVDGDNAE